jgi:hypothetical protein
MTENTQQKIRQERYRLLLNEKFPETVNQLEHFLSIWPELEDVTTEKNKIKSYFVLKDKDDDAKIFFFKSGFVKKVDKGNIRHLFLNNWYHDFDCDNIKELKLYPYPLELMIQQAHNFMISKKIKCNVDWFFTCKSDQKREKRTFHD